VKNEALIPAEFLGRDSRFTAVVRLNRGLSRAHIAHTGRLTTVLVPGRKVWLSEAKNKNRRTRYDLKLVAIDNVMVAIDSRLPNALFSEAVKQQSLNDFMYNEIQHEVKLGRSRIDFRLSGPRGTCWVETKSVTLAKDRIALFPDAPSIRGRKHLKELTEVLKDSIRSAVVFIVQRPDVDSFSPNQEIDPDFASILSEVARTGVEVKAYRCQVGLDEILISDEIPVKLNNTSENFHV
jgi:sugar fermentation stimulation protein A